MSSSPHFVVQTSHVEFEKDEEDDAVMLTHQLASAADAPVDDADLGDAVQAAPGGGEGEGNVEEEHEEGEEELDESFMGKANRISHYECN